MNKTNGMYKSSSVEEIRKSIDSAIEKIFSYMNSEAFKNYFPERSFVITTPESAGGFTYGDKAIFVAYQWTVSGTLTTQSGASYSLPERSFKGEAAHCYTVKYDVSNVGGVTITISFNDKVQTVKLDDIELNS